MVLSTQMLWLRAAKLFGVRHYLPEEPNACWSCSPPAPSDIVEPARLFPGGSVAVLAEYWLRVHETLDTALAGFERPLFVRHRDLIADPFSTLAISSGRESMLSRGATSPRGIHARPWGSRSDLL